MIKLKLSSQLIGQFGHVTASASCKQPEKHSTLTRNWQCTLTINLQTDPNLTLKWAPIGQGEKGKMREERVGSDNYACSSQNGNSKTLSDC